MRKFWNWVKNQDTNQRALRLEGVIAAESWFDDDVTPKAFRQELESGDGDITVWINSPGGDVCAASQIYTMLSEYSGNVTVKIDGMAASSASVIAMAATTVLMAPAAMMMIHDPLTQACGNSDYLKTVIAYLDEYKEAIINTYKLKTGLPRSKIAKLMSEETFMSAEKAMKFGFCDGILEGDYTPMSYEFNSQTAENTLLSKIVAKYTPQFRNISISHFQQRLDLLRLQI